MPSSNVTEEYEHFLKTLDIKAIMDKARADGLEVWGVYIVDRKEWIMDDYILDYIPHME